MPRDDGWRPPYDPKLYYVHSLVYEFHKQNCGQTCPVFRRYRGRGCRFLYWMVLECYCGYKAPYDSPEYEDLYEFLKDVYKSEEESIVFLRRKGYKEAIDARQTDSG